FELRFRRYVKTIGQTHLYLLGEKIIGRSVLESLALKKFAEEQRPWGQHVGIYYVGETAARKPGWRAVSARHFLGGDDDFLLCCCLSENRVGGYGKYRGCKCNHSTKPPRRHTTKKLDLPHKRRASLQNCNNWQDNFLRKNRQFVSRAYDGAGNLTVTVVPWPTSL